MHGKSNIDASRRHGRVTSLVADDVSRPVGVDEGRRRREREGEKMTKGV